MSSKYFCNLALLPVVVTAAMCDGGANPQSAPRGTQIVALFDLSKSTDSTAVRSAYCDGFRSIISDLDHGDAVAAGWITESSAEEVRLAVNKQFPPFDPETTNDLVADAMREEQDSLLTLRVDSIAGAVCTGIQDSDREVLRTDIMTSLDVAERIFENSNRAERELYIFSDMIEDTRNGYNFETLSLTENRTEEIIEEERRKDRLPDLSGVQVHVVGAKGSAVNTYHQLRRFWLDYFETAGADLMKSHYGTSFIE